MSEMKLKKITYNPMLNIKYDVPLTKKLTPTLNFFNEIVWVYQHVPHTSYSIPSETSSINEYDFFKSIEYDKKFKKLYFNS